MMVRTVLPVGVVLGLALTVYGGTGHDLDIVLQDRFPDDSEYSGLFTIVFGSALMVCAGMALGALVASRAWFRIAGAADGASPAALRAGLALSSLLIFIGFDDVMMVHDAVLTGAGVPEKVGLAAYAVVGVVLVAFAFRPLRSEGLGLAFLGALALLAGSLGGDIVEEFFKTRNPDLSVIIGHGEDIVKFLAYAALCHLCVILARRIFARTLQSATERAAREAVERAGRRVPLRATPATGRPHAGAAPGPATSGPASAPGPAGPTSHPSFPSASVPSDATNASDLTAPMPPAR